MVNKELEFLRLKTGDDIKEKMKTLLLETSDLI